MLLNFSWLEGGKVAGSARPGIDSPLEEDFRFIRAVGLKAIISLSEMPLPEAEQKFAYLHLPVDDFTPPSPLQIRQGLDFIKSQNEQGNPVLVHCGAGRGRTGTFLACYLVSTGVPAQQAIDEVRQKRPGSIETEEQEQTIINFGMGSSDTAPGYSQN